MLFTALKRTYGLQKTIYGFLKDYLRLSKKDYSRIFILAHHPQRSLQNINNKVNFGIKF